MQLNDEGVSPVIGIILMVAVTVALVALVSTLAFDLGNSTTEPIDASIQTEVTDSSVFVEVIQTDSDIDSIVVERPDGTEKTVSISSGGTGTGSVSLNRNGVYSVKGKVGDREQILKTVDVNSNTGSSETISSPNSNAPDCSTVSYEGSGTSDDPYKIDNDYTLQCLDKNDDSAYYQLTQNIDASGTSEWNTGSNPKGFQTLNLTSSGVIDGNGYYVKDLYIDNSNFLRIGFVTDNEGTIKNLGMVNPNMTNEGQLGVFTANNQGTIKNSYVISDTNTLSSTGTGLVGVIAGFNSGTISNTYTNIDISSSGGDAGGIVATNDGNIDNSYSNSDVSTSADGDSSNSISYNAGGLVGTNQGTVEKSYSTGTVTGGDNNGGAIGVDDSGSVTDVYWDGQSSGSTTSDGGTELTTSEMQGSSASSNMSGFDFSGTWDTVTNDYPVLQALDKQEQLNSR